MNVKIKYGKAKSHLNRPSISRALIDLWMKNSVDAQAKEGLRCLFAVTGGSAPSFHDLSVGEALAHDPRDRENSGGGKFPSQISHRKDQHGSPGIEEKISQPFHKIQC